MSGIKSHEISDPNFSTEKPEAHDLSEIAYEGGESHQSDRVVIVVSKWNKDITEALYQGAISVLTEVGVDWKISFDMMFQDLLSFLLLQASPSINTITWTG